MAKGDSGKKVARAARASGRTRTRSSGDQSLGFPLTVAAVLVLGTILVIYARGQHESIADIPPRIGDHWHAAFGAYNCESFLPNQTDVGADVLGIHTHGDGLLHIHPFATSAAGPNAQFGVWADQVNMDIGESSIEFDDGTVFADDQPCGDDDAEVRVAVWDQVRTQGGFERSEPREVLLSELDDLALGENMGITVALVPEGTPLDEIPAPPSADDIANVTDVAGGTADDESVRLDPEGDSSTDDSPSDGEASTTDPTDEPDPETTSSTEGG